MNDDGYLSTDSKPIVRELQHNGKKYFHLTCSCRYIKGGVFYSVVHEWDRLEEWIERLKNNHKCK